MDLTISGAMHEVEEQVTSPFKSNAIKDDKVNPTCQPKHASKQADTSNDASSLQNEVPNVVFVFCSNLDVASSSSCPSNAWSSSNMVERRNSNIGNSYHGAIKRRNKNGTASLCWTTKIREWIIQAIHLVCHCNSIHQSLSNSTQNLQQAHKTCWVLSSNHLQSFNNNQLQVYCLHLLKQNYHHQYLHHLFSRHHHYHCPIKSENKVTSSFLSLNAKFVY